MVRLRKSDFSSPDTTEREILFGKFRLLSDGTLLRGDAQIHLPLKELTALRLLLHHAGQIVTHQQLRQELWGDVHVTEDSVTKCMSSLREHLEPEQCIETVYKRGYRVSVEIHKRQALPPEEMPRLAVMPFASGFNIPPHLGPAIAEETITLLTSDRFPPALVLARDSVFTLARRGLTAQQVGEALHADLVLTGTLRALPQHFRLRVEMIRVPDGAQIWVEDMLVARSRIAGLESELAQRLFIRLNSQTLSFSAAAEREDSDAYDPARREAYELFLRGHHECQSIQRHRMQDGVQHLIRAIELDPLSITARVDLANACIAQAFYGFIAPSAAAGKVRWAAENTSPSQDGAPALLPAVGWVKFHVDWNLAGALKNFAASAYLPHEGAITRLRSMLALSRHRFSEAIDSMRAALPADPYSPWLNARLAWAYHLAGDSSKSLEQIERALEIFPEHEGTDLYGSIILAFNGATERAVHLSENLARRSPYLDIAASAHGYALACAGKREEAQAILERLQWLGRERFVPTSFTSAICVALGDLDGAIEALQTAADARCPWFFQMLADPRLKPLHGRAEFDKMRMLLDRMENSAN
jgi:DNA-binding winged helix-turn-helix (wHTH) protein/tetratricopeptide (TPR) repeat protein